MLPVRQQYVVYQVEILVTEGVAKFDTPIVLNGLKTISSGDGWVPLDIIAGPIAEEPESPSLPVINGRGSLPAAKKKKKLDDSEKEDFRGSMGRAKTVFRDYQYNTLKRLKKLHANFVFVT